MKINYYLLGFAGLFIFLVSSHFIIIFKYFQILIHHSIYYCLEMAKALNLQLSGDLGRAIVGILALAALFTAVRIFIAIFKVYSFRKYLSGNIIQTRGNVSFFKQRQPQAFCFGILKPKIYISSGLVRLMSSQELAVILRHEKYHLEKKDSLVFLMASLIESLFPFFPVISDFISVYRTDREVEADKIAIRSAADKRSLAEILKKLLLYEPAQYPAFVAGIISESMLEARINSLLMVKTTYKKVRGRNVALSLVSLLVLVGLMVTPINAIELHANGRDAVVICPI